MKRIRCETCGSNDMMKQDSVFMCQDCRCKYSLEEVKKMMVEIAEPVKVVGVDDADAMYNRALEWLKLGSEAKAVEVLKEMTEKYPGDKRGWQKLALCKFLSHSHREIYMKNALKFEDEIFIELVKKHNEEKNNERIAKRERINLEATVICEKVRESGDKEWVNKLCESKYPDSSCVRELLYEGRENAEVFNQCLIDAGLRKMSTYMISGDNYDKWWIYNSALNAILKASIHMVGAGFNAGFILGKCVKYSYYKESDWGPDWQESRDGTSEIYMTKTVIQQAFMEADRRYKNKLCANCARKKSIFNRKTHCPKCKCVYAFRK